MIKAIDSLEAKKVNSTDNAVFQASKSMPENDLPEVLANNHPKEEIPKEGFSPSCAIGVMGAIGAVIGLGILFRGKIKPAEIVKKVLKVKSKEQTNFDKFYENFIKNEKSAEVIKNFDFAQFGKEGIPLKYPRKNFITDIRNTLTELPLPEQEKILADFNLKFGMYDLDGIAHLSKETSPIHQKINSLINEFYHNNECLIKDANAKEVIDQIIKGFPEFNMVIGKIQHPTHAYSVDIHSLEALKKCYKNISYKWLSQESKEVLTLSVLMHDFGKAGNVITQGHAAISLVEAEKILKNTSLPENIKTKILRQIENHHWFEGYSKDWTSGEDLLKIFPTNEDLKVAKIMAKADLESISPGFHRYILGNGNMISQEKFDEIFMRKINEIPHHEYQDFIDEMVRLRGRIQPYVDDYGSKFTAEIMADSINLDYLYANKAIKRYLLKDISYTNNEAFGKELLRDIPQIDHIVNQGYIPRDITLWRGGSANDFGYSFMQTKDFLSRFFKKGKKFRIPCYLETSLDKNVSMDFALGNINKGNAILYKYNVPKGTPGVYLERTGTAGALKYDDEQEIMLPRDLIGKFKSKKVVDGVTVIEIDIVPPPKKGTIHEFWTDASAQDFYRKYMEEHYPSYIRPNY